MLLLLLELRQDYHFGYRFNLVITGTIPLSRLTTEDSGLVIAFDSLTSMDTALLIWIQLY